MKGLITIGILIGLLNTTIAQSEINGEVIDHNGHPIPFATICLNDTSQCTISSNNGRFKMKAKIGDSILIQTMGYKAQSFLIQNPIPQFTIEKSVIELEAATIIDKSNKTKVKESAYTVNVIDAESLKTQNLDVNQILNKTSGIRIRESGGLGSDFNFSLNGFSGRQVRFFINGIPMDNFGSSLTLNNIPVNLISRMEVYKGVVPIRLGSDALGGAVNIITDNKVKNYFDFSYSIGSFNTHRLSLNSRYTNKKTGLIINTNAFLNHSDNNYKVEVSIPDLKTGKYGTPETVERFHDSYQSKMLQVEVGFKNKKIADQLFIGIIASNNHKEIQTGANMTQVAGEMFTEDQVIIPTIKYKKENFFIKGLTLNTYSNYNHREALRVDTSSKIFDWHGNYKTRDLISTSGELTWYKTMFRFNDNSFLNTSNLNYQLNENHSFSINNTYTSYTRVGEDPITYGPTPFREPNTLIKNITGLSYSIKVLKNRLDIVAFGKLFHMNAKTYEGTTAASGSELTRYNVNHKYNGYGLASTFHITNSTQIKTSYENTYRLPDAYEMFGNGLLLLPNAILTAERSNNYNLSILSRIPFNNNTLTLEGGYLFRLPENLIRLQAVGVTSQYENLSTAKANIFELSIKYLHKQLFQFEINSTYQNIINNQEKTAAGGTNYLYKDRIPNTPFLFSNASIGVNLKDILTPNSILQINWHTLYVEAFYLKWPSQGSRESKYDIPRQISHNISASYALKGSQYNISLSCTNLFNKALYDNFMLQKPGRAIHAKVRYYISK